MVPDADDDETVVVPPRPLGVPSDEAAKDDAVHTSALAHENAVADTILRPSPHTHVPESTAAVPTAGPRSPAMPDTVARTMLGFRLGDSPIVLLDSVVYLGRKPSPPRITNGAAPRLVRVVSATNEVSSTHIELRQLGAMVVVTDLKSTNGTRVLLPGHPVRSLRPGESITIGVGTLIDVGDGNVLELVRPGVSR